MYDSCDPQPPTKLIHTPIAPPRASFSSEVIYLKLWQEFATARPKDWAAIFHTSGPVRQRAASVAASFIVFMGCAGGRDFTARAIEFADKLDISFSRESAFIAIWAIDNQRQNWRNHNLRLCETILASEPPYDPNRNMVYWGRVPTITNDDHDILESMVRWWASPQGGTEFRTVADALVDAEMKKQSAEIFKRTQ